jgi:hypothetical protein
MKKIYLLLISLSVFTKINAQQFAANVINYSSQYASVAWSASQATGSVNTYPLYGDITTAWATATSDASREYISLGYSNPQPVSQILVYETYNCGAVDTIYLRNANTNTWNIVYTTTAASLSPVSRVLNVIIPTTSYPVNGVRLALNSGAVPGWNEIDAVQINSNAQVVGLNENKSETIDFGVFPNPNNGTFTIKTHQQYVNCSVEVLDVTGRLHFKTNLSQSFQSFSYDLPNGVYFVKLSTENGNSSVKKMIIK